MKNKKYRVVRDGCSGYEVQVWRKWWPFWIEYKVNTWTSLEKAKEFIKYLKEEKNSHVLWEE